MSGLMSSDLLSERLVKLETEFSKDMRRVGDEIVSLKQQTQALSQNFYMSQGEQKSITELFSLFVNLDKKFELDRQHRILEHKEILDILSQKMDSDKPAKWAIHFQKIVQWITWFLMLLGSLGIFSWLKKGVKYD